MNDKALMEDLLTTVKSQCDLFLHATVESSTPNIHDIFNNALFECLRMQNEIYNKMSENGWYPKQNVEMQKIQQLEQKFVSQMMQ